MMNKMIRHTLSFMAVTFYLLIAVGSADETDVSTQEASITVTARQLHADYEANGVAAEGRYEGEVLLVTGEVKTIDKAAYSDDVYVVLSADWPGKIKCYFAKSNAGQASQLSKGEVITVKGMCDGKFGNEVELKGCSVQ